MIKASELRQENLLNARYHNNTEPSGGGFFWSPVVVWSINGDLETITTKHGESIPISEERLQPIPLTAEWLERFGFEPEAKISSFISGFKKGRFAVSRNDREEVFQREGYYLQWGISCSQRAYCKYAHELQSLYRFLTGEELTIKEKQA